MANKNNRIGEKFTSNEGYEFIIIEYNNCEDLWIQFEDKYGAKVHTRYQNCKRGNIKNPYHPNSYNKGCLGLMSDGSKPITTDSNGRPIREYSTWHSMLNRCYSGNYSTYEGCEVCDRWLIYANFLEDIKFIKGYELWKNNPNQRICLDKDLLGNGSKLYSLDTCCFITIRENVGERNSRYGFTGGSQSIKVYGINMKTGERTKVFNSLHEVERETGANQSGISRCLNNKQKSAGGYTWYKVEENLD